MTIAPPTDLTVLVVGCGSIGTRHLRNLRTLRVRRILAHDPLPSRLEAARMFGAEVSASLEEALEAQPDAALICTPPTEHTRTARAALEAGAHLFIEKPLATSLEGVEDLLDAADRAARSVAVGYNLRFHRGIRQLKELVDAGAIGRLLTIRAEVGQYLPDWRPGTDYRAGYVARHDTGGGIILEASHELDYVTWIAGDVSTVFCAAGHVSSLEFETEDVAATILRFASGAIGEIHADCFQRGRARNCKIIGNDGTLLWDIDQGIRHLSSSGKWAELPMAVDLNDMYLEEVAHFLRCVGGEDVPLVDGRAGLRTLRLALAARRSAQLGAEVQP